MRVGSLVTALDGCDVSGAKKEVNAESVAADSLERKPRLSSLLALTLLTWYSLASSESFIICKDDLEEDDRRLPSTRRDLRPPLMLAAVPLFPT